jgi:hypothetical protein
MEAVLCQIAVTICVRHTTLDDAEGLGRGLAGYAPSAGPALGHAAECLVNRLGRRKLCSDIRWEHHNVAPFLEALCVLPAQTGAEVVLGLHLRLSSAHSPGAPGVWRDERQ